MADAPPLYLRTVADTFRAGPAGSTIREVDATKEATLDSSTRVRWNNGASGVRQITPLTLVNSAAAIPAVGAAATNIGWRDDAYTSTDQAAHTIHVTGTWTFGLQVQLTSGVADIPTTFTVVVYAVDAANATRELFRASVSGALTVLNTLQAITATPGTVTVNAGEILQYEFYANVPNAVSGQSTGQIYVGHDATHLLDSNVDGPDFSAFVSVATNATAGSQIAEAGSAAKSAPSPRTAGSSIVVAGTPKRSGAIAATAGAQAVVAAGRSVHANVAATSGAQVRVAGTANHQGSTTATVGASVALADTMNKRGGITPTAGSSLISTGTRVAVGDTAGTSGGQIAVAGAKNVAGPAVQPTAGSSVAVAGVGQHGNHVNATAGATVAVVGAKHASDCAAPIVATTATTPSDVMALTSGVAIVGPPATALDSDDGDTSYLYEEPSDQPPPANLVQLLIDLVAGLLTAGNGLPAARRESQVTFDPIPTSPSSTLASLSITVVARLDTAIPTQLVVVTPDGASGGVITIQDGTYQTITASLSTPTITAADLAAGLVLHFSRYQQEPANLYVTEATLTASFADATGTCVGCHPTSGSSVRIAGTSDRTGNVAATTGAFALVEGFGFAPGGVNATSGSHMRSTFTADHTGTVNTTSGAVTLEAGTRSNAAPVTASAGSMVAVEGVAVSKPVAATAGSSTIFAGTAHHSTGVAVTAGSVCVTQGDGIESLGIQATAGSTATVTGIAHHTGTVRATAGATARHQGRKHGLGAMHATAGTTVVERTKRPLCGAIDADLDTATITDRLVTASVRATTTAGRATGTHRAGTVLGHSRAGTITEQ